MKHTNLEQVTPPISTKIYRNSSATQLFPKISVDVSKTYPNIESILGLTKREKMSPIIEMTSTNLSNKKQINVAPGNLLLT